MKENIFDYYCQPDEITNLKKYLPLIQWLPENPDIICQVVQGLIVHDMWVTSYGVDYNKEHEYVQKTAYMEDILEKILEIDGCNLAIPRQPQNRVIACCREFATLMCAFLRVKGIPARSRCGFATYFGWNDEFEDHWVCEYWNGTRWIMCDPQLDPFQHSTVIQWGLDREENAGRVDQIKQFNPHDLKSDEFVTAGQAWNMCRQKGADASKFGIGCPIRPEWGIDSLYGLWFVRGQLLRDFASLNKVETVPYLVRICKGLDWKSWHLVYARDEELTNQELRLLDDIATLTCYVDDNFSEIQKLYANNKELAVPLEIIKR